jgi:micrococcal nuclease
MEIILAFVMMVWTQWFGGGVVEPVLTPAEQSVQIEVVAVMSVIDGDTIRVSIDGVTETVRYIGIDTPEPYRDREPACYSAQATAKNQALLATGVVTLVADVENRDRYNRLLRYVYVDGTLLNEQLVRDGYATTMTIPPNTAKRELLSVAEADAQAAGAGLWSACAATAPQPAAIELEATPEPVALVDVSRLSAGQQQLLETLGIDATAFTITQQMITCAEAAVGADRVAAVTAGGLPTFMEGVRLVGCYRQ